tara:strand:+ start:2544 stop:2651 length:108 start_codon:yes stop_codon:yes gene_type:complete
MKLLSSKDDKKKRLAEALRANLKKRKDFKKKQERK